jgi:hypothetical protein
MSILHKESDHFTSPDIEITRRARATFSGQAHLADLESLCTCRQCIHWLHVQHDYRSKKGRWGGLIKPARCAKYRQLTGNNGDLVPDDARACRHFEPNPTPPARFVR